MGTNKGNPGAFNAVDFMDEIRIKDQTFLLSQFGSKNYGL